MGASRLLSFGLLTSLSAALASGPAGNENYAAQTRALRAASLGSLKPRSGPLKYQATSVSFTVGQGDEAKDYLSPIGESYKSYTMLPKWGLEGFTGQMVPVTVFNVEGEVTCDILGDKLAACTSIDDVWDEVSPCFAYISNQGNQRAD